MFTFKKEERLCSKKLLGKLFHDGSSFLVYPFRITHLQEPLSQNLCAQVVINVSKRKFKHAVDRNQIKRRIREIYRLHKGDLFYPILRQRGVQVIFSINYIGKDILPYSSMEKKLILALKQLIKAYVEEGN